MPSPVVVSVILVSAYVNRQTTALRFYPLHFCCLAPRAIRGCARSYRQTPFRFLCAHARDPSSTACLALPQGRVVFAGAWSIDCVVSRGPHAARRPTNRARVFSAACGFSQHRVDFFSLFLSFSHIAQCPPTAVSVHCRTFRATWSRCFSLRNSRAHSFVAPLWKESQREYEGELLDG